MQKAIPHKFKETSKWEEWVLTFVNFLQAIPGRNGVPLSYIIHKNDAPVVAPHVDFLDDYSKFIHTFDTLPKAMPQQSLNYFQISLTRTIELILSTYGITMKPRESMLLVFLRQTKSLNHYSIQVKRNHICGGTNFSANLRKCSMIMTDLKDVKCIAMK